MVKAPAAAAGLRRQVVESPSAHVQLALVHVPGPQHDIEAEPYLRVSLNIGPSFAIDVIGPQGLTRLACKRHSLLIIPPARQLTHRAGWAQPAGQAYVPVELATFRLSQELVARCAMLLGLSQRQARVEHQIVATDEVLRPLAYALLAQLRAGAPDGAVVVEKLASALLGALLVRQTRTGPKATARAMDKALAHIEARLGERVSLDELAAAAGMSRFHFCRVFRAQIGSTPHQYMLERRIELARRLLWTPGADGTTLPAVLDVALACGFTSASHFSAQFRRHAGKSPVQWQRARPA